jgi:hypothetical protein
VTGIVPDRVAGRDARDELTIRVFRPLYQQFDLRTVGGTHIAVPRGDTLVCWHQSGSIARQISENEPSGPSRCSNQTGPDV